MPGGQRLKLVAASTRRITTSLISLLLALSFSISGSLNAIPSPLSIPMYCEIALASLLVQSELILRTAKY